MVPYFYMGLSIDIGPGTLAILCLPQYSLAVSCITVGNILMHADGMIGN